MIPRMTPIRNWSEGSLESKSSRKPKHDYDPDVRDFYKLFFLCEKLSESSPKPGPEAIEVGFFQPGKLPPLSTGRVLEKDILAAFS